ncbi:hypothetical protein TcBrA4_0024200 [Trypanosoma cruzi]|nr:hypothetical protein TcBrA4_0024200 [Trypanosoma cruzi]
MSEASQFDVSQLEIRLGELEKIWKGVKELSLPLKSTHRRSSLRPRSASPSTKPRTQCRSSVVTPNAPPRHSSPSLRARRQQTVGGRESDAQGQRNRRRESVRVAAVERSGLLLPPSTNRSRSKSPVTVPVQRNGVTGGNSSDMIPNSSSSGGLPPLETGILRQAPRFCPSCGFARPRVTARFCQKCGNQL